MAPLIKTCLFLTLAVWVRAINCPVVTCSTLGTNLCASRTPSGLQLNSNGCAAEHECSVSTMYQWWGSVLGSDSYTCPATVSESNVSVWVPTTCRTKQPNKNFKSLDSFVQCTDDSDCVLVDNTVAQGSCTCGLRSNGLGVCQPDVSNDVFAGYWTACGTTNQINDQTAYDYWAHYLSTWVYLQTDLTCTNFLVEIAEMTQLHAQYYSSAVWIGLLTFSLISVVG